MTKRPDLSVATPEELEVYLKLLKARKAMESPLNLACYASPSIQRYPHTEYLDQVVTALIEKRLYRSGPGPESVRKYRNNKDVQGYLVHPETGEPVLYGLILNMPPRHGKSLYIGKHLVPYYLMKYPEFDKSLLYVSYSAEYSQSWGLKSLQTVEQVPELGYKIDPKLGNQSTWKLKDYEGRAVFLGVGGSITGRGGNGIIDDPIANGEQAMSPAQMEKQWDWYLSTFATRIERECWQIIIQTRWAFNDITGRLLETEADNWFVVNMPALAYETTNPEGVSIDPDTGVADALGRTPGEALCPELFDTYAAERRRAAEPFWFDAQYQGKPTLLSGAMFRNFRHYRLENGVYELFREDGTSDFVAEKACYRFATMDLAATTRESSDYTVFAVWDVAPDRTMMLREIIRERVPADQHENFLFEHYKKWKVRYVGVEKATYGLALLQRAVAKGNIFVRPLKADQNKRARAIPATIMFQNNQIFIPLDAPWRGTYELELTRFDKDTHDDQVDVTAYAALEWEKIPATILTSPPVRTTTEQMNDDDFLRRTRRKSSWHPEIGGGF